MCPPRSWQTRPVTQPSIVAVRAAGPDLVPEVHGAKACGLQRLLRSGLRVPPAVVIPVSVAPEPDELAAAVGSLTGARLAVRSGAAVSLPGAYDTVLDVDPVDVGDAVAAVRASAGTRRALAVARALGLDAVPPTAVLVQSMVDTTGDEASAAGAATSVDPVTGDAGLHGSVAWRARGDAVMGGSVPVEPIEELGRLPAVLERLDADVARLHDELGGPLEVEFGVESGVLWYLQLRRLETPPPVGDGGHPAMRLLGRGRPASAGFGVGELHTDVDTALDAIADGRPVVLALETAAPADVEAMVGAAAVVTVLGGPECHAAVVTRRAGVPAVVSVQGLRIDGHGIEIGGTRIGAGDAVAVDGTTGRVGLP